MTLTQNELYALILAAILIVALIAVVAWAQAQRRRKESLRLQQRFGPEYVRLVNELGRAKAEAELATREKRVATLTLLALPPAEAARFRDAWIAIQARFVDGETRLPDGRLRAPSGRHFGGPSGGRLQLPRRPGHRVTR